MPLIFLHSSASPLSADFLRFAGFATSRLMITIFFPAFLPESLLISSPLISFWCLLLRFSLSPGNRRWFSSAAFFFSFRLSALFFAASSCRQPLIRHYARLRHWCFRRQPLIFRFSWLTLFRLLIDADYAIIYCRRLTYFICFHFAVLLTLSPYIDCHFFAIFRRRLSRLRRLLMVAYFQIISSWRFSPLLHWLLIRHCSYSCQITTATICYYADYAISLYFDYSQILAADEYFRLSRHLADYIIDISAFD